MEQHPTEIWDSEFGEQWTERNQATVEELNKFSEEKFGVGRVERLESFVGEVDRGARILEVGANVGNQLKCFEELGFDELYGIDIQRKAIQQAHQDRPELDIIEGNAFDIPFKDGFFDLVFTSGVLIHIPPQEISMAMSEIARCTSELVYGVEYYAKEYTEINYRGYDELLWKTDFPSLYEENCGLELVRSEQLKYPDSDNVDVEFLLRKPDEN